MQKKKNKNLMQCFLQKWEVFVSEEEFWSRFNLLESKVGLRQGSKRGWFTYTELNLLLQLIDLSNVIQCFWNVSYVDKSV